MVFINYVKPELVEYLICPKCASKFALSTKKVEKNEIITGILKCTKNHKFEIKFGIPRLVVDSEFDFIKTESAFSSKWKKFNKTYHNKKWYDGQKKWFLERFEWKTLPIFNKFLNSKKFILDAGTGVGNSAHLFSHNKKSQVFAIDASESVIFAYKKYGNLPNVHFIQTDIRKLPFKKNFFDFICSDQVLHHTKDTQSSFKYLTKFLQKSGIISIYVYKKKAPIREFSDDHIRKFAIEMTEKECMKLSKDMALLGKSLSKLNKKIRIDSDIPVLGIKAGVYDVQRFIYWNFLKCWYSKDVPFEQSIATNFDWYFPKYAYRHTPKEVKKWFQDVRLKIIHFNEIDSGINVTGIKQD
jgi:ubiquinone/menaquinone biosynthesis C-methylase UbiE/uncharacterized protein YbaR (Trm112 family)